MTVGDAIDKIMSLPNIKELYFQYNNDYIVCIIMFFNQKMVLHQKSIYLPITECSELTTYAYWDAVNTIRRSQCAA